MAKKKKTVPVKINTKPKPRETNDIICDTVASPEPILDLNVQDKTTEESFNHMAPSGSTRNDLTITFRYNFDRISELKEKALKETKKNWEEDKGNKDKNKRRAVQYTDLMRRAIDEKYFGE